MCIQNVDKRWELYIIVTLLVTCFNPIFDLEISIILLEKDKYAILNWDIILIPFTPEDAWRHTFGVLRIDYCDERLVY